MASLFSNIAANAALWSRHEPDYATQLAVVGATAGSDHTVTSNAIVSSNAHSPTVVAFQLSAEPTKIYIGHSPIRYPSDLNAITPFDELVMVMVGDDLEDSTPVVLPADAFTRSNDYAFYNKTYTKGPQGHTNAHAPVVQFELQATGGGVADTDEFRVRKVMLMPHSVAAKCVQQSSDGTFNPQAFEATIIDPEVNSGDADRVNMIGPVELWWRASGHHAPGHADQPVRLKEVFRPLGRHFDHGQNFYVPSHLRCKRNDQWSSTTTLPMAIGLWARIKQLHMLGYLWEIGYDLCLDPEHNISGSPGFEVLLKEH